MARLPFQEILRMSFILFLVLGLAPGDKPAGYARPELLVEPGDLLQPGARKTFIILDARPKKAYEAGHVPGAVWVDADAWARAFAAGQVSSDWAKRVGALGIDARAKVVVYDANRAKDAARIWWILRYWGVKDARLLNGGWGGWLAAGGKPDREAVNPKATTPKLTAQPDRLATKEQILAGMIRRVSPQLLDVRSSAEYCGTTKKARRNGAIVRARHLEWSETLDKAGRFKSAPAIRKLLDEAGIDPARPVTTYCQSGGRAAVMAFVLELLGGKEVRNYYRSWSEWGNDKDLPIMKPRPKE
jgi:thiosulfate/3-mercaptopyruvate sulfurtransferase